VALAVCGYGRSGFYLLDACQCFNFLAENARFLSQSSGKNIIILLSALTVLITEVVFLETLYPAGPLSLQILETHEPG
jgi:hypothetical protein